MSHSDNEVRDQLSNWIVVTEPQFDPSTARVRDRARLIRRRRRAGAAVAVAATAAVLVTGAIVGQSNLGGSKTTQGPAASVSPAVDPGAFSRNIERVAGGYSESFPGRGEDAVRAFDGASKVIEGQDRDKATRWQGQFYMSPDDVIDVNVLYEGDAITGDVAKATTEQCAGTLKAELATTCEVTTVGDVVLRYTERLGRPNDGGWIATTPSAAEGNDAVWGIQQVLARYPDGFAVFITEASTVGTPSDSTFKLHRERLTAMALDPTLRFPRAPRDKAGCEWTIADHSIC